MLKEGPHFEKGLAPHLAEGGYMGGSARVIKNNLQISIYYFNLVTQIKTKGICKT